MRTQGTRGTLLVGAAGSALIAAASLGAPVPVVNPGFEDITGETPVNEFTFGPLNGWALYDPDTITDFGDGPVFYIGTLTPFEPDPVGNPGVYANFPDGAIEGQRVAICFNFFGSGDSGEYGLEQTNLGPLQADTTYTLEVEIGNIASGTAMSGQFFPLDGFPGYRVELRAGTEMLECDDNTLAGTIPDGEWATSTVTYTTQPGDPIGAQLAIRLVNLNITDPMFPNSDLEVDFDDVRLDASPASCDGDADGDGTVDVNDIGFVIFRLGDSGAACIDGDVDGNGVVDVGDIAYVIFRLGMCGAGGAC